MVFAVFDQVLMRHGYGMECDVWSVGVILYIMLCGCPPFGSKSVTVKVRSQPCAISRHRTQVMQR